MRTISDWMNDPRWLRDLGLDASLMKSVRAECRTLRMKDGSTFYNIGSCEEEKASRRLRMRLGNPWISRGSALLKYGCLVGTSALVVYLFFNLLDFGNPAWYGTTIIVVLLAASVAMILLSRSARQKTSTPYYATILRRHGIVVCPKCGYHASNRASKTTCPECGLEDPLAA